MEPRKQRRWKRKGSERRQREGVRERKPLRGWMEQGQQVVAEHVEERMVGREQGEGRQRKGEAWEDRAGSCEVAGAGSSRAPLQDASSLERFGGFLKVVENGQSLKLIGCSLAWLVVHAVPGEGEADRWNVFQ